MTTEPVTSTDVFLWALYELGASEAFVDVEDAMILAFELAPKRFSWRTRDDLPDKLKGNMALHGADVQTPKLLIKSGSDKRRLTAEGQQWIEANFERLATALRGDRVIDAPKAHRSSRRLSEIQRSGLFMTWQENGALPSEKWRFAEMLRCAPDSAQVVWRDRVATLRSAAYSAAEDDVLKFLDQLTSEHPDWF